MSSRDDAIRKARNAALEDAAELADGSASLYAAYAGRERSRNLAGAFSFREAVAGHSRPPLNIDASAARAALDGEERARQFDRDAQTCADLARRIRALKEVED